jgi:hypothetical protein
MTELLCNSRNMCSFLIDFAKNPISLDFYFLFNDKFIYSICSDNMIAGNTLLKHRAGIMLELSG